MATVVGGTLINGVAGGIVSAANGGDFNEGFLDGASEGLMLGGIFALGSAAITAIKSGGMALKATGQVTLKNSKALSETPMGTKCFVAGTGVLTATGIKAIEDISVGDMVWTYNEQTGQNELKVVVQLFRNEATELVHVNTSDGQIISATAEHPFYVINGGWLAAKDLRAGDRLLLTNGKYVVVEF